ncbi:hypothetical protein K490DRAFT_44119 [Saccharata proteae CBS 121410]|uniref:Protein transport protein sec73 n=1 Tax=Saccharata proteae CBS 121410 TaxID=1314787 RepID=A0A9P4LZ07_9PEZI|nr:hypothetical protein K490DRAFT_44119 [Saccharata proteae CBS 121410]
MTLLRPGKSDKNLKRRSTLDPTSILKRNENAFRAQSAENLPSGRGIASQDGPRPYPDPARASSTWAGGRPPSPPIQEHTPQTRRFSMLRFRHASDPQLSAKAKEHAAAAAAAAAAEGTPPVPVVPSGTAGQRMLTFVATTSAPNPPAIITTAPTMEPAQDPPKKKKYRMPGLPKRRLSFEPTSTHLETASLRKSVERKRSGEHRAGFGGFRESEEDPGRLSTSRARDAPSENGSQANPGTRSGLPGRLSDSSRSDGSSNDHVTFVTNTTKKPALTSAHSSIFKLPRRNKDHNRKSLFPLPVKIPPPPEFPDTAPATPRASTSAQSAISPRHSPDGAYSPPLTAVPRSSTSNGLEYGANNLQTTSHSALSSAIDIPESSLLRNDSTNSGRSARSSPAPALAPPARLGLRGRSSTMGSLGGQSDDTPPTPPHARTSLSTAGRSSFSNLFGLSSRFRQGSAPESPRHGSPGQGAGSGRGSHSTSFNMSREALVVPEREEGESPGKYLERLEGLMDRSVIASVVARSGDDFSLAVLRSYMRRFNFFGDPIDIALRKLLMEVELPRETQQIDRVLQGFADRYHECNPGIFMSPEEAYFIAFSIVLLNSDFFNPNNKRKMQKPDYIKNCNGSNASEVSEDVLATIYDNIVYTQFIHIDDEVDLRSITGRKNRKKIIKTAVQDPVKKAQKEPLDPYTLILENKLNILRPPIRDVMQLEDPYSYRGTAQSLDMNALHRSFARYGVIQIVSARSRPEAFMTASTIDNPDTSQAGVVEMPVTKVGILWRKDTKKKAARSPWQEWGAVLTRSGLSFFKNSAWAKALMHQYEQHQKQGHGSPVVFKPAMTEFKADHMVPMDHCVAAMDTTYKKHKHAFVIFAKGGAEEIFLADSEGDMNDWLAKVNYTAAFESSGIRPRGLLGGNYEGQRNRGIRRLESSQSTRSIQGPTGEVTIQSGKIDNHLAQQIATARRENIRIRVSEAEDKLGAAIKQLDSRLRDARHLQVMAPIQPRTREHVVHAAGKMAARLKWIHIEICRMKCHRDILLMDLDDETRAANDSKTRYKEIGPSGPEGSPANTNTPSTITNPRSSRFGLHRLNSIASTVTAINRPKSPTQVQRPDTVQSEHNDDDVFTTPPETSRQSSPAYPPAAWGIPPMSFTPTTERRSSILSDSPQSPQPDGLGHRLSVSGVSRAGTSEVSDTGSHYDTAGASDVEASSQPRNHSSSSMNLDGRPSTPSESTAQDLPIAGSPESRSKVRRSLHRTLRDGHGSSGHRRSGKGKESSSTIMSDELGSGSPPEMLPRTHGSFTLHGKKASVVTFGSEWQNLSAEERLKLRKQASDNGSRLSVPNTVDDTAPTGPRDRAASTSTNTASLQKEPSHPVVEKEDGVGLKPAPLDAGWKQSPSQYSLEESGLAPLRRPSTQSVQSLTSEELSPTTKPEHDDDDENAERVDVANTHSQAVEA